MMIQGSREKVLLRKQEGGSNDGKTVKEPTSSRLWSGLKDSRIVRVSRSFGGKDRHSKVRTIRGLRDRRVRLSVPTAIQLYDLQDRLGLNQPSKVVDWLLNVAQEEIDKLPPLDMASGNIIQYPQSVGVSHEVAPQAFSTSSMVSIPEFVKGEGSESLTPESSKGSRFENNATEGDQATLMKSKYWNSEILQRTKFKDFPREEFCDKGSSMNANDQENNGFRRMVVSAGNELKLNNSSLSSLPNNFMPYTAYFHQLDSSYASISHLEGSSSQVCEDPQNCHPTIFPSSQSSMPISQILLCPSGTMPSNFQSYLTPSATFDRERINNFQMAPSASQTSLPNSLPSSFHPLGPTMKLSISPKHHNSKNDYLDGDVILCAPRCSMSGFDFGEN